MRKLIAGLLLLCASAIFAQEAIDAKYVALLSWAQELSQRAQNWNETCKEDGRAEGCQMVRLILNEQFKYFIECANRYSVTGTNCRAATREHVIKHEVRLFTWNLLCVGQETPDKDCESTGVAIIDEEEQIQKEITQCGSEKL